MIVELLLYTPEPLELIYKAARTCYSPDGFLSIQVKNQEKMKDLINKIIKSGHHSVLEHISFSFAVDGVSRALTHQLVRHRLASFSQQSQRYVEYTEDKLDFIIPKTIKDKQAYKDKIKDIFSFYREMIDSGVPKEDARYILPNATTSKLVMTMNYRELIHFCKLRLCFKAQWEIRTLTLKIRKGIATVSDFLGDYLKPKCQYIGFCDEEKPCGNYFVGS